MEQYFATVSQTMEGYGDFEAEALAFKVCVSQPLTENGPRAHEIISQARTPQLGKAPGRCTSG